MPVYQEVVYDAICDTCDAAFSPIYYLVSTKAEFAEYGWIITETETVLCNNCARREGASLFCDVCDVEFIAVGRLGHTRPKVTNDGQTITDNHTGVLCDNCQDREGILA